MGEAVEVKGSDALSNMLGIYDGFEGYRDPTEDDALALLKTAPVVLDTNALLDIYGFEEPARVLALEVLEALGDRLWIPHQVMREFWRNRHSVIAGLRPPAQPIDSVRAELLAIVNSLRPDRERPEEIQEMRKMVEQQLATLTAAINDARGEPLDVRSLLDNTGDDPVLTRLESTLAGRVGLPFGSEEPAMIKAGLERFAQRTPPGYKDGADKQDQVPERGTGDYLLWEQTLRYVTDLDADADAFIIVSNDVKEDWRVNVSIPGGKKESLGVRPELVAEALERTGKRLVLLRQNDFYRLMAKIQSSDEATSESLVEASTHNSGGTGDASGWSHAAYERLLVSLRSAGNGVQADVIALAAQAGGFLSRAAIFEHAEYSEERSLRRFAFPAQRIALDLAAAGLIADDAELPLEAVYDGPGKATGYRVPEAFVEYETTRTKQLTWVQAAAQVAAESPDQVWTPADLVAAISEKGLRDLSNAQTPEATLRRDLSFRDVKYFEPVDGGFRLRRVVTPQ